MKFCAHGRARFDVIHICLEKNQSVQPTESIMLTPFLDSSGPGAPISVLLLPYRTCGRVAVVGAHPGHQPGWYPDLGWGRSPWAF